MPYKSYMKQITVIVTVILSLALTSPEFCAGRINGKVFSNSRQGEIQKQYVMPIELSKYGHIEIKAKVNNVEGTFILDTGAGINVITKKFASKLGKIKMQDGSFTGFRATGEPLDMQLYTISSLEIGDLQERNSTFTILDVDLGKIDGLISLASFKEQPFTIDYANKKLYLESRRSLMGREKNGKVIKIQLDDDRGVSVDMFTKVRVNNKLTLQISLDSGAGFNVFRFNAEYLKSLVGDTTNIKRYNKQSSLNAKDTNNFYLANLNSLALYDNPTVNVHDIKASFLKSLIYDGITSINWLGKCITIDIRKKELIIN